MRKEKEEDRKGEILLLWIVRGCESESESGQLKVSINGIIVIVVDFAWILHLPLPSQIHVFLASMYALNHYHPSQTQKTCRCCDQDWKEASVWTKPKLLCLPKPSQDIMRSKFKVKTLQQR